MKASKLQWTETYGVCCSGGGVKLRNWRCGGDGGGVKTRRSEFFVVADGLFDNASHVSNIIATATTVGQSRSSVSSRQKRPQTTI